METLAQFFMGICKQPKVDYTAKFRINAETANITPTDAGPCMEEKKVSDSVENSDAVVCPKCGVAMISRKATKGQNAGKEFFGCSNFPKCRYIINIQ